MPQMPKKGSDTGYAAIRRTSTCPLRYTYSWAIIVERIGAKRILSAKQRAKPKRDEQSIFHRWPPTSERGVIGKTKKEQLPDDALTN